MRVEALEHDWQPKNASGINHFQIPLRSFFNKDLILYKTNRGAWIQFPKRNLFAFSIDRSGTPYVTLKQSPI